MSNSGSGALGCGEVLTVVFVVLKLTGLIDWSWLWVLSPVWIPMSIAFLVLVGVVGYRGLIEFRRRNE